MEVRGEPKSEAGGSWIRRWRDKRGMSLNDLSYELRFRYGRKITAQGLGYHETKPSKGMDLELAVEIAGVFDLKRSDLDPELLRRAEKFHDLLAKLLAETG